MLAVHQQNQHWRRYAARSHAQPRAVNRCAINIGTVDSVHERDCPFENEMQLFTWMLEKKSIENKIMILIDDDVLGGGGKGEISELGVNKIHVC